LPNAVHSRNCSSPMKRPAHHDASTPPPTIVGVRRKQLPTLSPCAWIWHDAAVAAGCTSGCMCVGANFQFRWFSCMQGECQAAELDTVHQYLNVTCGTLSPAGPPMATTSFLPPNSHVDIHDPTQTVYVLLQRHGHDSYICSHQFKRKFKRHKYNFPRRKPNCNPQYEHLNSELKRGAQAGVIVASVVTVILLIVLVIFWRLRRHRQQVQRHRAPEQFLESLKNIAPTPTEKVRTLASAESTVAAEVEQPNLLVARRAQRKQIATLANPRPDSDNLRLADSFVVAPGESAGATAPRTPQEPSEDEDTVTLRVRRLEAQRSRAHSRLLLEQQNSN
ncbi:hypothetical protein C8R45DRAFT_948133, partial [Mycena sanguinolenta]